MQADIDQNHTVISQAADSRLEKCQVLHVVGNIFTRKGIDNQDIIFAPRSLHERQSVTYMTYDIPRQAKVTLRQLERDGVDFDNRNLSACSRQHRAESATAAADHENAFPGPLQRQSIEGMDVCIQADAVAVGRALIAALLFVSEGAASFSEAKLDDAKFGSVLKRWRTHWNAKPRIDTNTHEWK